MPQERVAERQLQEALKRARLARLISFDEIRDDSTTEIRATGYDGHEQFWSDVRWSPERYRLDRQRDQLQFIELWCEAAGMVPQLERVAEPYGIPVYSNGGTVSVTATHAAGMRALEHYWEHGPMPTLLLHVGDHDPTGDMLYRILVEDAEAFTGEPGFGMVQGTRVALTDEQIDEYDLPTEPPKRSDPRTRNWDGDRTAQLEALPPDVLARLLREAILDVLDIGTFQRTLAREADERADLLRTAENAP